MQVAKSRCYKHYCSRQDYKCACLSDTISHRGCCLMSENYVYRFSCPSPSIQELYLIISCPSPSIQKLIKGKQSQS